MQRLGLNSNINSFKTWALDIIKLSLIWLFFSLPLVTIGASTVAAYAVTFKLIEKREVFIFKEFKKNFLENLKQGIPLGLIHLVVMYSFYLNLEFLTKFDVAPIVFFIAVIGIGFLSLLCLTFAFPLCARYHNTLLGILINSVTIAIKFFMKTFMLWLLLGMIILLFTSNILFMFLGILVVPGCVFLIVSKFSLKIFNLIEKETMKTL